MTLDDISQQLATVANSGNQQFANAAQFITQVVQTAQAGQMTPAELTETLQDVQRQMAIVEDMSQMAFKETLNTCINGLITIAGAVG